ncbi:hypothetical protein BJ508DRAFT_366783 [Ascobolus immersus RN42]|uniref:Uncharacterized protein n=1 Tax=Ascobolus immersus RN42 TaxID=1160509 RepID=A0A3N4HN96_ASCIM|nr:hypothetical protein BJ508DRAFT_366783 [Ascobolus immersus RN42]
MGLFSQYGKVERNIDERELQSSPSATAYNKNSPFLSGDQAKRWDTNALKRLPKLSFIAFIVVLAVCGFASYVIASAHETPVAEWNLGLSPSVWLALCTVAINTAVTALLDKGAELYWWSKAVKYGQTPTELHDTWSSGKIAGALFVIFTKFKFSRLAAAAIFAAAVRVNGPLFQQAVNTTIISAYEDVQVSAEVYERLPDGWSGILAERNYQLADISTSFADVFSGYMDRSPVKTAFKNDQGCGREGAKCEGYLPGTGFKVTCKADEPFPYAVEFDRDAHMEANGGRLTPPDPILLFTANITSLVPRSHDSGFNVTVRYKDKTTGCKGTGVIKTCEFVPYLLKYKVKVTETMDIVLLGNHTDDIPVEFFYPGGIAQRDDVSVSTFGGFTFAFKWLYESSAGLQFAYARGWRPYASGLFPAQHRVPNPALPENMERAQEFCHKVQYKDPMPGIIAGIREVAFRSSVLARPANNTADNAAAVKAEPILMFGAQKTRCRISKDLWLVSGWYQARREGSQP